jgi:hypothetical protein
MLSRHDVAVRNVRRYSASGVRDSLRAVGFRRIYLSYWNAALFLPMAVARKLLPGRRRAGSDVRAYPRPIDLVCRAATSIETMLLRSGIRLPFGGSVLAIAVKEGVADD